MSILTARRLASCAAPPAIVTISLGTLAWFATPSSAQVTRRVYERFPPRGAATWTLPTAPVVAIGVATGESAYEFSRIVAVVPFRGGVLVADGTSNEIRHFDADGRHVRTVGGEGQGPGEFEQLRWMAAIRGDTVLAWDLRNRRLTRFDPDLELIESTRLASSQLYVMAGAFLDGELLLWPFRFVTPEDVARSGVHRDTASYARARLDRPASLDTVLRLPSASVYTASDGASMIVPFTTTASATVGRDAIWAGNGTDGSLVRYDRDGTPRVEIALPPGRRIEAAEIEAYVERPLENFTAAERAERRRLLAQVPVPDELPTFDRILADDQDRVWIRRHPAGEDDTESWAVFRRDGAPVAALELPRSLTLLAVRDGHLLGVLRDELDIERVVVYEIPG